MFTFSMSAYLIASICFILSLRGLSSPETARKGNIIGAVGMALAIIATIVMPQVSSYFLIVVAVFLGGAVGTFAGKAVKMTALPQMVAAFNGFGGLASVLVSMAEVLSGSTELLSSALGMIVGAIAFTGSIIAFAKLYGIMSGNPITFKMQHQINAALILVLIVFTMLFAKGNGGFVLFFLMVLIALLLGFLLVIPIGGADMPVVISVLNSYSGWAACAVGFALENPLLIITGALVGASGAILSYIMCKGMNRSIFNVVLGGFGGDNASSATSKDGASGVDKTAKSGSPEDAAFVMKNASKVIIVPGYGMAVAQAQHVLREMADALKKEGVTIKYAIHPVAGRMPGHMNVLLAEANVPYDEVFELDDINREFATADAVYVIGANDVTNPLAKTDSSSPIYGMPVLDIDKAKTVFFVKRSLASGYAGIDNPMFYADNTMMLFGDAKKITESIVKMLGA
ncbi:MAG: NAD(P)(+) transhydrogenase (Re/Si-specific) subunit beta [Alphaproteobacteria bacterium]